MWFMKLSELQQYEAVGAGIFAFAAVYLVGWVWREYVTSAEPTPEPAVCRRCGEKAAAYEGAIYCGAKCAALAEEEAHHHGCNHSH